jgi:hypothetical protein
MEEITWLAEDLLLMNLLHWIISVFCSSFKSLSDLLFVRYALESNKNISVDIYVLRRLQFRIVDFKCRLRPHIMKTPRHKF